VKKLWKMLTSAGWTRLFGKRLSSAGWSQSFEKSWVQPVNFCQQTWIRTAEVKFMQKSWVQPNIHRFSKDSIAHVWNEILRQKRVDPIELNLSENLECRHWKPRRLCNKKPAGSDLGSFCMIFWIIFSMKILIFIVKILHFSVRISDFLCEKTEWFSWWFSLLWWFINSLTYVYIGLSRLHAIIFSKSVWADPHEIFKKIRVEPAQIDNFFNNSSWVGSTIFFPQIRVEPHHEVQIWCPKPHQVFPPHLGWAAQLKKCEKKWFWLNSKNVKKSGSWGTFRMDSGWLRVARDSSGSKLAARPKVRVSTRVSTGGVETRWPGWHFLNGL